MLSWCDFVLRICMANFFRVFCLNPWWDLNHGIQHSRAQFKDPTMPIHTGRSHPSFVFFLPTLFEKSWVYIILQLTFLLLLIYYSNTSQSNAHGARGFLPWLLDYSLPSLNHLKYYYYILQLLGTKLNNLCIFLENIQKFKLKKAIKETKVED